MSSNRSHDVALLGCGLLGSAFARAFARNGRSVVAWNRTYEKAETLAADKIDPVHSVVDAVRTAPLVLTCMTNYAATWSAVRQVDSWRGKALINLSAGVPDDAEKMEAWAHVRGAGYLDGAVLFGPREVGSSEAIVFYSGSPDVWSRYERELMAVAGSSTYLSNQAGMAMIAGLGAGAFHVAAYSAFVEAATYMYSQSVSPDRILEGIMAFHRDLPALFKESIAAIASNNHESDQTSIHVYAEAMRSALAMIKAAGQPARVSGAAMANLAAADAAGLGNLGFSAQTKVMRETTG